MMNFLLTVVACLSVVGVSSGIKVVVPPNGKRVSERVAIA